MRITTSIFRIVTQKFSGHRLRRFKIIREFYNKLLPKLRSNFAIVQESKMFLGEDHFNLSIYGIYEPRETKLLKQEIRKGDTVIDIGASIGYYTLLFSRLVGENGRVFAFESNPDDFDLLKKNVLLNDYKNIIVENKAVSNRNGESVIYRNKAKTIRLDDYFHLGNETKIDFIKMDIEGHEKHAFEGMENILQKNKTLKIMVEFNPQAILDYKILPKELLEIIENNGFKMFDILQDCKPISSQQLLETYPNSINPSTNIFCKRIDKDFYEK